MRTFLKGVGVGMVIAYVFHDDLDEAVRKGLLKANQVVGTSSNPPQTPTEVPPS